jgi:DnaJ-class molecular chaperone
MVGDDDNTNDLAGDAVEGDGAADCPACGGTGEVHLFTSTRPCKTCGGRGKVVAEHEVDGQKAIVSKFQVGATTTAGTPANVAATPQADGTILLSWTQAAGDASNFAVERTGERG